MPRPEEAVMDLVWIGLVLALYAVTRLLIGLCDRLR